MLSLYNSQIIYFVIHGHKKCCHCSYDMVDIAAKFRLFKPKKEMTEMHKKILMTGM